MTAPNMAAITASLERSLQLNQHQNKNSSSGGGGGLGVGKPSTSSDPSGIRHHHHKSTEDTTLELNSNISLPYHWEQCLDLKTGEVYYINWRTGMKAKEDPRTADHVGFSGYLYSDDDEEDEDEDDENSYYSEGSSSESSPAVSSLTKRHDQNQEERDTVVVGGGGGGGGGHVLVVAGCKSCLMYFMVPKQVEDCPKCCGQLLHFDRSDDNASP